MATRSVDHGGVMNNDGSANDDFENLRFHQLDARFVQSLARLILQEKPFSFALPAAEMGRLKEIPFLKLLYQRWHQSFKREDSVVRHFQDRLLSMRPDDVMREQIAYQESDGHVITLDVELTFTPPTSPEKDFLVRFTFPRATRHASVAEWSEAHAQEWHRAHPGGQVVALEEGKDQRPVIPEDLSEDHRAIVDSVLDFSRRMVALFVQTGGSRESTRERLSAMKRAGLDPDFIDLKDPTFEELVFCMQPHLLRSRWAVDTLPMEGLPSGQISSEQLSVLGVFREVGSRLLICIPELREPAPLFEELDPPQPLERPAASPVRPLGKRLESDPWQPSRLENFHAAAMLILVFLQWSAGILKDSLLAKVTSSVRRLKKGTD